MSEFASPALKRIAIIKTDAHPELAEQITAELATRLGIAKNDINMEITESQFANSETNIILKDSIRGRDVFIITTGATPVNDNLMSLFLIIDGCKRSSAHSVNVIMPAYPYARSDKRDHRGPISSAVVATMLNTLGVDRLISCDIHSGQIQGFFPKSFDNLYCKNVLIKEVHQIARKLGHVKYNKDTAQYRPIPDKFLLCSPDAGGIKRIKAWAESLGINYCSMDKQRDYTQMNIVHRSRFIGDPAEVAGRYIIIVDDIADTLGTMMASVAELQALGAAGVYIFITHAYLSGEAINRINSTDFIKGVVCTNSLPQKVNKLLAPKLQVASLAPLLSEVIWRIQSAYDIGATESITGTSTSLSQLFE
jgi:ribose-phosphate pyrophosphokinase